MFYTLILEKNTKFYISKFNYTLIMAIRTKRLSKFNFYKS